MSKPKQEKSPRFPGWTEERWEAEKKRLGTNDKTLYDILKIKAMNRVQTQHNIRFFMKGR